jgi:hypothetical protein
MKIAPSWIYLRHSCPEFPCSALANHCTLGSLQHTRPCQPEEICKLPKSSLSRYMIINYSWTKVEKNNGLTLCIYPKFKKAQWNFYGTWGKREQMAAPYFHLSLAWMWSSRNWQTSSPELHRLPHWSISSRASHLRSIKSNGQKEYRWACFGYCTSS